MAERAPRSPPVPPPPSSSSSSPNQLTTLALPGRPISQAGTYVVQVPKDQIYRVPPPENALLAERYRGPGNTKNRNRCSPSSPVLCCSAITAILAVVAIIAIIISFFVLKPKNPGFILQRLVVRNRTSSSSLEYDLSFSVSNRNKASGVVYKSQGATSALSFGKKKLGTGKFPSLHQGGGDTTSGVRVVVRGIDGRSSLPKEIQKSLKGKKKERVSLGLVMKVPVRMKTSSFKTGDAVLVVTCDFDVDTLAKGTRILSQDCNTQRR